MALLPPTTSLCLPTSGWRTELNFSRLKEHSLPPRAGARSNLVVLMVQEVHPLRETWMAAMAGAAVLETTGSLGLTPRSIRWMTSRCRSRVFLSIHLLRFSRAVEYCPSPNAFARCVSYEAVGQARPPRGLSLQIGGGDWWAAIDFHTLPQASQVQLSAVSD